MSICIPNWHGLTPVLPTQFLRDYVHCTQLVRPCSFRSFMGFALCIYKCSLIFPGASRYFNLQLASNSIRPRAQHFFLYRLPFFYLTPGFPHLTMALLFSFGTPESPRLSFDMSLLCSPKPLPHRNPCRKFEICSTTRCRIGCSPRKSPGASVTPKFRLAPTYI